MTTFGAVVVYARTKKEAIGYAPGDLRDELSGGVCRGSRYGYTLQEVSGTWELRIAPVSGEPMRVEDLWALEGAHDFTGYAFKYRPVDASDAELQVLINEVTERGLHWAVALY